MSVLVETSRPLLWLVISFSHNFEKLNYHQAVKCSLLVDSSSLFLKANYNCREGLMLFSHYVEQVNDPKELLIRLKSCQTIPSKPETTH